MQLKSKQITSHFDPEASFPLSLCLLSHKRGKRSAKCSLEWNRLNIFCNSLLLVSPSLYVMRWTWKESGTLFSDDWFQWSSFDPMTMRNRHHNLCPYLSQQPAASCTHILVTHLSQSFHWFRLNPICRTRNPGCREKMGKEKGLLRYFVRLSYNTQVKHENFCFPFHPISLFPSSIFFSRSLLPIVRQSRYRIQKNSHALECFFLSPCPSVWCLMSLPIYCYVDVQREKRFCQGKWFVQRKKGESEILSYRKHLLIRNVVKWEDDHSSC